MRQTAINKTEEIGNKYMKKCFRSHKKKQSTVEICEIKLEYEEYQTRLY